MSEVKDTPISQDHSARGGKMVDFAGWNMPVEFIGLRKEHENVREKVGLFDVSHMGEIWVSGDKSLETLEWLTTNAVTRLENGQAQYSLLGNPDGGIVDDIIVYCVEREKKYLICVNAANIEKDFNWIVKHNKGADVINDSENWGQIAVQGPNAVELTGRVLGEDVREVPSFSFVTKTFNDETCYVARTGYTGEDGFEIFIPKGATLNLWQELISKGEDLGAMPIGLGARDTLRTEMKFSLYGHEIDDTTNPYEAGLGWVVKAKNKDFLGRDAMVKAKESGLQRKLVGFVMVDRGIPRHGYKLLSFDNEEIGGVTSGTVSPSLNDYIGIGYVKTEFAAEGSEFLVEIRQRKVKARVVKTPFVNTKGD